MLVMQCIGMHSCIAVYLLTAHHRGCHVRPLQDGAYEASPTCGWQYQGGKRVLDSQGFCCSCDAGNVFDATFGSNTQRTCEGSRWKRGIVCVSVCVQLAPTPLLLFTALKLLLLPLSPPPSAPACAALRRRANLDCDFFANLGMLIGQKPTSAHCLKWDPQWFGVSGQHAGRRAHERVACLPAGRGHAAWAAPHSWAPETGQRQLADAQAGSLRLLYHKTGGSHDGVRLGCLQGYSLGPASLQFDIVVSLSSATDNSTSSPSAGGGTANISQALTLSPSVPLASAAGGALVAKLLGDLAGYTQLPVLRYPCSQGACLCPPRVHGVRAWRAATAWLGPALRQPLLAQFEHAGGAFASSLPLAPHPPRFARTHTRSMQLLMVPQPLVGQTLDQVLRNQSMWMLVPRDQITFDGNQCDKVGTSFNAFRYQTSTCKRAPQVCGGFERVGLRIGSMRAVGEGGRVAATSADPDCADSQLQPHWGACALHRCAWLGS